jgi:hypothetical protein
MSDAFYSPSTILKDKRAWLSAVISLVVCGGIVGAVAYWRAASSVIVRPIVSISVSPIDSENSTKPSLSAEDIKKLFEDHTKINRGDRFVVYTAPLSEVCKNKETSANSGTKLVIAQTNTSDVLGTIKESEKNCDVAAQLGNATGILVTSPIPFPLGVISDRKLVAVAQ